jgi:hypothetical protein
LIYSSVTEYIPNGSRPDPTAITAEIDERFPDVENPGFEVAEEVEF